MTAEADQRWQSEEETEAPAGPSSRRGSRLGGYVLDHAFSSLTRRIAILNLAGLVAMVTAILYLNQFREGLIDARVQSLLTQGEIIAGAISASAVADPEALRIDPEMLLKLDQGQSMSPTDEQLGVIEFLINPEKVAPILRRLISPTRTRARIYDRDGVLVLDSRHIFARGQILRYELPPPSSDRPNWFVRAWEDVRLWLRRGDLPLYEEIGPVGGRSYAEVDAALNGSSASIVRVNDKGELIVSVAVPIQRFRAVHGALLLSTEGGDIDAIVAAERLAILRIFLVAAVVTLGLSILLASTIAGPVHRLAAAAEQVRYGTRARAEIPDFSDRNDEIGHLSRALRDMTRALYLRIEAIESFAADVAHELKNPLTSLKSAVETLPLVKRPEDRARLIAIVQQDVERLNRLITDISDASRLDAELARTDVEPVDIAQLLETVVSLSNEVRRDGEPRVELAIAPTDDPAAYFVAGRDTRLGQVVNNLVDNAKSFSPPEGTVRVSARRLRQEIEILVDDDGPGIPQENAHRIFERFYTDRGDRAAFGSHSGLGLSISRQIVEAHGGRIWAENRKKRSGEIAGARFGVRLPAFHE
ncbi:two-component system sensor histidine kinase ChvG [Tepidamorphus gemmatus]|jgi:two-component system sensor histidine kinase ChvG|uniref:histidine kinase n=1 Tax=Tepidamorphus gemmatus TaxID=747076 RepID=A0A4R3MAY4_9HYPH|nr:sensor histidine kinase [Tepidamorphus gemmatus]TCT10670.1 two-component system sensor histidine kinase ChvG [Tepidamorphus gemmatus]